MSVKELLEIVMKTLRSTEDLWTMAELIKVAKILSGCLEHEEMRKGLK